MEMPALIETTVRLFPDKESEAASKPRAAIKGHATVPLYYCPLKGREDLFSSIFRKCFDLYRSNSETLEEVRE